MEKLENLQSNLVSFMVHLWQSSLKNFKLKLCKDRFMIIIPKSVFIHSFPKIYNFYSRFTKLLNSQSIKYNFLFLLYRTLYFIILNLNERNERRLIFLVIKLWVWFLHWWKILIKMFKISENFSIFQNFYFSSFHKLLRILVFIKNVQTFLKRFFFSKLWSFGTIFKEILQILSKFS